MTTERKLVQTSRMPMRWGDMDALGHVNNTVYFRYMEQVRIEWLHAYAAALGGAWEGQGPVIINASCTFLEPLIYPGEVEVAMFLGKTGRTSVESYYEISMQGKKYAEGESKMVWIDMTTMKSVPLPAGLLALLAA
jgi:acyl-CoA thioester hydrolase